MNVINSAISYLLDFAAKSEATYHVNPWIFCVLFFGSAIPLYYGYYRIGRSALIIMDRRLKRKKLDSSELKIGIAIAAVSWWIPYIYVIIFGKLPWNYWLIFAAFVIVMGTFFVKTLIDRVSKAKKESSE